MDSKIVSQPDGEDGGREGVTEYVSSETSKTVLHWGIIKFTNNNFAISI